MYLLQEPTEDFLRLENPYDPIKRGTVIRGVDYVWDTAYYNGHFYLYFGILPALLVFVPFYIFTKKYLQVSFVIFVVSIFILIFLKEILIKLLIRYFKNIKFKSVFLYLITLYSGSLLFYLNGISRFYELAVVFGLFFALLGILYVIKAMENEKYRYLNLFCGSLFLALSVACRPIDLLISLAIVPYLLYLLIKNWKENKKNFAKLIICVGIPYITIGILLMIYNYVRFDNPFEFGFSYQLTVSNSATLKSGFYSIPNGLFTNLFSFPKFKADFPFVDNYNDTPTFYGYYYIENMLGGLFIFAPICFSYFLIGKANKKEISTELRILIWTLFWVSIFIAVLSVSMSGSVERYLADYAWMFILNAILIVNIFDDSYKNEETKELLQKIISYMTVFSFIVAILFGIVSEKSYLKNNSTKQYYETEYTVCFWE